MKLNNLKLNRISLVFLVTVYLSLYQVAFCHKKHKNKIKSTEKPSLTEIQSLSNPQNQVITPTQKLHIYHKNHKKSNLRRTRNHENQYKITQEVEEVPEEDPNSPLNLYFKWGVFVPLVILIFIITIIIIVAFIMLVINTEHRKFDLTQEQIEKITAIKRANFLAKLGLQMAQESEVKDAKKKKKKGSSYINANYDYHNYTVSVKEPESEGMVVKH